MFKRRQECIQKIFLNISIDLSTSIDYKLLHLHNFAFFIYRINFLNEKNNLFIKIFLYKELNVGKSTRVYNEL